ncbi:MAG: sulfatase, partial [Acidobacteria bacterium]
GCYGQTRIRTPRIDRMAAEGTRFTACYSGSPVCAPSRNVLMTGLHTGHTRIRDNSPAFGGTPELYHEGQRRLSLESSDVTVAEILKSAGYRTGITGKWGLGEPFTPGTPNRQGFDEWLGFLNQNHAADYYTDYLWQNESRVSIAENREARKGIYVHDRFTEFALQFIRTHRSKRQNPFFLYLAYTIPHETLTIPELGSYANESWDNTQKTYGAMVSRLDRDVGRVLDLLGELGLDRKTLVFFTSDNGAPDKPATRFFRSNALLRGHKADLYEGGIRVPMIARWPGRIAAGKTVSIPWYFADLLPTAAHFAQTPCPAVDGRDVSGLLLGSSESVSERWLYWEKPQNGLKQAVRKGRWKAVRHNPGEPTELYDLEQDPSESENLAASQPGLVCEIESYLKTARTESPNWPT